jgi:hypothetical protein
LGQDCKAEKNGKACRRKKKDLKKDPSWWVRGGGYWTAHFLIGQLDIGAADSLVFFVGLKTGDGSSYLWWIPWIISIWMRRILRIPVVPHKAVAEVSKIGNL